MKTTLKVRYSIEKRENNDVKNGVEWALIADFEYTGRVLVGVFNKPVKMQDKIVQDAFKYWEFAGKMHMEELKSIVCQTVGIRVEEIDNKNQTKN